jgi:hypothetical protein
MPELSRFLGIVIAMYYRDHPPPHFHAVYAEYEATINIHTPAARMTRLRAAADLHVSRAPVVGGNL